MNDADTYHCQCFCGAVKFTVTGKPEGMGYCHCESCRRWSAGPVNAFTLWKPDAVTITHGTDHIGTYNNTEHSYRKWCRDCGGHLFTEQEDDARTAETLVFDEPGQTSAAALYNIRFTAISAARSSSDSSCDGPGTRARIAPAASLADSISCAPRSLVGLAH